MSHCDHAALKRDDAAWAALRFVGIQPAYRDEPALELRDCPRCLSTLARPVTTTERRAA